MSHSLCQALVLTSAPGQGVMDTVAANIARSALNEFTLIDDRCLGEGEAWQILFACDEALDVQPLRTQIAAALGPRPIDVNIVQTDLSYARRKLFVADMDSTIIQQECIDEMADVLGLKPQISVITERAMRGELQFEDALCERLALLAGISEAQLEDVYRQRIVLMPGARTLVATMKGNGATTALVSGGFTFFTSRVAAAVGFDHHHANTLGVVDGRMTGQVVGPILGKEAKLAKLEHYRSALGLAPPLTLAVGDGANDLAMIGAAGLGVAYRAKPIVAADSHASVTHGDLTALLYLQGYRREEFVTRA
jgi:phosphoserine phosphatase